MNKFKLMFSLFDNKLPKDIIYHISKFLMKNDIVITKYKYFKSRYKSNVYYFKYNTSHNYLR